MLVWAEPFDLYGANAALVPAAGYTDVVIDSITNTVANVRTGLGACFMSTFGATIRGALTTPVTTFGMGAGVMTTVLGGGNSNDWGFRWESAGKTIECSVCILPDLSVGVFDRTNAFKGSSAPNSVILNSYYWIEAVAIGNTAGANTGQVIVKVNGQTKLTVNGINLPNIFTYYRVGKVGGGGGTTQTYIDDWIVWDNQGAKNNNFMSDRRLITTYPNANLALQDFIPTPAGNAWDRINDSPPTGAPADTAYIEGALAGNISEFSKTGIPIAANDIAAIVGWGRLAKSDAGAASARLGINSAGNIVNSPDLFPGTTFAWFQNIWELDPNGNIAWTKAAADAAAARITRVT